jgi:hypothetical protein
MPGREEITLSCEVMLDFGEVEEFQQLSHRLKAELGIAFINEKNTLRCIIAVVSCNCPRSAYEYR